MCDYEKSASRVWVREVEFSSGEFVVGESSSFGMISGSGLHKFYDLPSDCLIK